MPFRDLPEESKPINRAKLKELGTSLNILSQERKLDDPEVIEIIDNIRQGILGRSIAGREVANVVFLAHPSNIFRLEYTDGTHSLVGFLSLGNLGIE